MTYVFLLLVNMANLEPDVFFGQRARGIANNVFEALQTLVKLLLLLVYDSQAEVDLIGLLEIGCHAHHLRESLFRMVQRTIAIIQDTDSIPQLGFLGVAQVVEGLLVRGVCLLQIIHHEMAVAQAAPSLTIARIQLQNILQVLNRFWELFFCPEDT